MAFRTRCRDKRRFTGSRFFLYFLKTLIQGKKVKFRLKPKLCFTGSKTFVSMANKIDYATVKDECQFYMQVTRQGLHHGASAADKRGVFMMHWLWPSS